MISAETVENVKNRADIVQIISETVSLKRQGTRFFGCCPFHAEKTPSFAVFEESNSYYCFGCQAAGDCISFVMKRDGMSYPEAIRYLADKFGIAVKEQNTAAGVKNSDDSAIIFRLNERALKFFRAELAKSELALGYLEQRGISEEAIKEFQLGYAPLEPGRLYRDIMEQSGVKKNLKKADEILVNSGLFKRGRSGSPYETFRGRIIFPIEIESGRIAGFGGRIIPSNDPEGKAPKYLNSSETAAYHKSSILYGLPIARREARAEKVVFLVEGYLDVISLWQNGVKNVVATCGTALTAGHLKKLSRVARKAIVFFDGDLAGYQAAGRSFETFLNSGIDASAIMLKDNDDPDTFARSNLSSTREAINSQPRSSLLYCYVLSLLKRRGVESPDRLEAAAKGELCSEVAEALSRVINKIERDELLKEAAVCLQVDYKSLGALLRSPSASSFEKSPKTKETTLVKKDPREIEGGTGYSKDLSSLPRFDRELLHAIMALKEEVPELVLANAEMLSMLDPATCQFTEGLFAIVQADLNSEMQKSKIHDLLKAFGPGWARHWRDSYRMREEQEVDLLALYHQCHNQSQRKRLASGLEALDKEIRACTNDEEKLALLQRRLTVIKTLHETA
jgi:DNA primase